MLLRLRRTSAATVHVASSLISTLSAFSARTGKMTTTRVRVSTWPLVEFVHRSHLARPSQSLAPSHLSKTLLVPQDPPLERAVAASQVPRKLAVTSLQARRAPALRRRHPSALRLTRARCCVGFEMTQAPQPARPPSPPDCCSAAPASSWVSRASCSRSAAPCSACATRWRSCRRSPGRRSPRRQQLLLPQRAPAAAVTASGAAGGAAPVLGRPPIPASPPTPLTTSL